MYRFLSIRFKKYQGNNHKTYSAANLLEDDWKNFVKMAKGIVRKFGWKMNSRRLCKYTDSHLMINKKVLNKLTYNMSSWKLLDSSPFEVSLQIDRRGVLICTLRK